MPRPNWSRAENEATVASYFTMLEAALRGEPVNKAVHRRALLPVLDDRTEGAIEFKHQNISAILIELGVPYISGYKPAANYQHDLLEVVAGQLEARRVLREVVADSVAKVPAEQPSIDPAQAFTDVPPPRDRASRTSNPGQVRAPVDYVQMEAHNTALGLAGERFVVDLERARLEREGKGSLAGQVSHVSRERGDGFGYDVLSFEANSREKLIEVKTTKYGEYTPFFVSRNELKVSHEQSDHYHLYRVYAFGPQAKVFCLLGAIDSSFQLDVASYIAKIG